jgi:deoxycytidylate deaminase
MAEPAVKIATQILSKTSSKSKDDPLNLIRERRSQELVIGLCGAVGSGVKNLKETLEDQLGQHGYHVEHIRLSELIAATQSNKAELLSLKGFERYTKLQDLGDEIRERHGNSILAELAIRRITILRNASFGDSKTDPGTTKVTKKVAYIINQIKHPSEITLLREVYRNNFYLMGLLRTEEERRRNLKEEPMPDGDVATLIDRDRKSSDDNGQHVEKSLFQADYFIQNIDVAEEIVKSVTRFIKLVHGTNHITPKKDETGIYAAYSASLRSACLSRQVGAAIADEEGVILSTGCNDVPSFGGGLYNADSSSDKRCFNSGGLCHNDKHKRLLKEEIELILKKSDIDKYEQIAEDILLNSKAKSLIEYSRAIHAEMDAITALARSTNNSTINKTLYCTTYPCHVCARHIVAAGIKRVVYIEPYEKSLAIQLHADAICHSGNGGQQTKVIFENFEGVSPSRYAKFFGYGQKRKDSDGKAIPYTVIDSGHVDPQHLDSYGDYELKVVQKVNDKLPD